jgi:hypothetical protein
MQPGAASKHAHIREQQGHMMQPNTLMPDLVATQVGMTLTFNRELYREERDCIAVTDVIRRMPKMHICDHTCSDPCDKIEKLVFTDIPDPSYMVYRTAELRAYSSPPAQGKIQMLQQTAQRLLSAMRANAAAATEPDYLVYDIPTYMQVI